MRLFLLPAVSCLTLLWAQSTSEHLTVGQPSKVSGKRNDTVQTKIPVTIQEGYHVNSNKPADPSLIPTSITWTSLGALQNAQVTFPKASSEKYEFSPDPLLVFSGNVELTVSFKIAPNAPAGPGIAAGKLRYQACNSRACYPPKNVDINIPYQVQ